MANSIKCPVCGKYDITYHYEECPFCSWMYDPDQMRDTASIGANDFSLEEARILWKNGLKTSPDMPDGFDDMLEERQQEVHEQIYTEFLEKTAVILGEKIK